MSNCSEGGRKNSLGAANYGPPNEIDDTDAQGKHAQELFLI